MLFRSTHAYDAPDLSPIEFLQAVYHATHLPMSIRIDAARGLLPFTEPAPRPVVQGPTLTIVIGGIEDPEQINSETQLKEFLRADNCQPRCGDPDSLYTETNSNPPTFNLFIDYSTPPDPAVFEAARKWGFPEPHPCSYCGHWLTKTYPDCICTSRDPSKMN